jgi:putative Holliday junction resolvase
MDGTAGERAARSLEFADMLRDAAGLEVTMWDERLTTVDARRILNTAGRRGKKRKEIIDAVAAALILEGYLGGHGAWDTV